MTNKAVVGANLLVSKVKSFVVHLFERFVEEKFPKTILDLSELGLFYSYASIIGYSWYYRTLSFHVCVYFNLINSE